VSEKMRDLGGPSSMSRSGNGHDNAVAESCFQLLKRKWIRRQIYPTRQDARADVFHYIEMFYNPKLRHNTSGSVSPVEFGNVNPNGSEVSGKSGAIQFLMFTSCAIRVHFMSKTA